MPANNQKRKTGNHVRHNCQCRKLSDLFVIPLYNCSHIYKDLETTKERGGDYWWLNVRVCKKCGQFWLAAQEERYNDLFIIKKLNSKQYNRIINQDIWPQTFDKYETLIHIGRNHGYIMEFYNADENNEISYDEEINSTLIDIVEDLVKQRPEISDVEISDLLDIPLIIAQQILAKIRK